GGPRPRGALERAAQVRLVGAARDRERDGVGRHSGRKATQARSTRPFTVAARCRPATSATAVFSPNFAAPATRNRRTAAAPARHRRAGAPRVEAQLALRHLLRAPEAEALLCAHVVAVDGARRRDVQRPQADACRAPAEVEVLPVAEVARVEAAELAERVGPHR